MFKVGYLFGRRDKHRHSLPDDSTCPPLPAGLLQPAEWLGLVLRAIREGCFLRASAMANKASDLFSGDELYLPLFNCLANCARAYQAWYQSWDYDVSARDMRLAATPLDNMELDSLGGLIGCFIRAEADGIQAEQEWMRFDLAESLRLSMLSLDGFSKVSSCLDEMQTSCMIDSVVLRELTSLAFGRATYQEGIVLYLQAYSRLWHKVANAQKYAQKACERLNRLSQKLKDFGAFDKAGELRLHQASLQNFLDARNVDFALDGTHFTWTFRSSFPREAILSLINAYVGSGKELSGYRLWKKIENRTGISVLGVDKSTLNDVFRGEIGEDSFKYLEIFLPSFSLTSSCFSAPLVIRLSIRFYAIGVVGVYFHAAGPEKAELSLSVSQIQFLRLLGLPQTPGFPIQIDWLPPHNFTTFTQVCQALLNAMRKFFEEDLVASNKVAVDALYAVIEDMSGFPYDRAADEYWLSYALIRVYEIAATKKPLEQVYGHELAAISQAVPESIDTLDVWRRSVYQPLDNLAAKLSSRDTGALLFVSNDHVLLHMPHVADWVQMEYLDIVEFQLNILVATNKYLDDLESEIRSLHQTRLDIKSSETTPKTLKHFIEQRLHDIQRINSMKSQLVTLRSLAHASRVTLFAEHRALLEHIYDNVNLGGAIQQAENLASTLMDIEEDWDYVSRFMYQEQLEKMEQRRSRIEDLLTFFLQLIGITGVISAIVSIIVVQDTDRLALPWWFGDHYVWTMTGSELKLGSMLALGSGIAVLFLAWLIFTRKPRK